MFYLLKMPCGRPPPPPLILAWLSLWVVGGLCVACPCGRFVIRQGLCRSWQVLGRMSSFNKRFTTKSVKSFVTKGPLGSPFTQPGRGSNLVDFLLNLLLKLHAKGSFVTKGPLGSHFAQPGRGSNCVDFVLNLLLKLHTKGSFVTKGPPGSILPGLAGVRIVTISY